jgi:hypothetical protein
MALIGSVNGIPVTKGGGDVATNTGVGTSALVSNTNGNNNSALGYQALDSCTSGFENVAMGSNAAAGITSGSRNTIIGNNAGASLTTGNNNTIIGGNGTSGGAGESMTTGSRNTIVGGYTGNNRGIDIRSANDNVVVSDGSGLPRFVAVKNVGMYLFTPDVQENTLAKVTNNTKGGTVNLLSNAQLFPWGPYFGGCALILLQCGASEGTAGAIFRTDQLFVANRFGSYTVNTFNSYQNDGVSISNWTYSYDGSNLRVTQNWSAGGSSLGTYWNFIIITGSSSS